MTPGYVGIDVGSISTNVVLLAGDEAEPRFTTYIRGAGSPIASVQRGLAELRAAMGDDVEVAAVGVTGSGRELIAALVGGDVVKNEISAHAKAAIHLHPDVSTIIEIGGQDSKVTIVRDGAVVDFAMNLVCAAGTGSFLDSQARRLSMDIADFGDLAVTSTNPTPIAGRCTVFAESDMIHKQQMGFPQADILMGLCLALARNFVNNVCRGKEIRPTVLLQGGVSENRGIRRAFEEVLQLPIVVPRYNTVMGALGAALIARENPPQQSRFVGFDISTRTISTRGFTCSDCPNDCDIIEILEGDAVVGRTGSRCGKWQ